MCHCAHEHCQCQASAVNVVEFSEQGSLVFGQVFEKQVEFFLVAFDLLRAHLGRELLVEEVAQLGQEPQQVDGPEKFGRKSIAFQKFLELKLEPSFK